MPRIPAPPRPGHTPRQARPTVRHGARRHRRYLNAASAALATVLLTLGLAGCGTSRPAPPSASMGAVIPPGHPVPATPLVNQEGQPVTLQSFRGKYVVLAQFLTLCQDECPLT